MKPTVPYLIVVWSGGSITLDYPGTFSQTTRRRIEQPQVLGARTPSFLNGLGPVEYNLGQLRVDGWGNSVAGVLAALEKLDGSPVLCTLTFPGGRASIRGVLLTDYTWSEKMYNEKGECILADLDLSFVST